MSAGSSDFFEYHGTSRSVSESKAWTSYTVGDITDEHFVSSLVDQISPTHVLHLAGASNPQKAEELFRINLQGTWNLLSACTKLSSPPRILLVGSAAGFGEMQDQEDKLNGNRPARPNSLYGLVREQALGIGKFFLDIHQLPVLRCRTFNIVGPGLPNKYAPTAILERLLRAQSDALDSIAVGNLDHVRDFIDVRDACMAWNLILRTGKTSRIYSVGSGTPATIRQLTEEILKRLAVNIAITEVPVSMAVNRSQITRSVADIAELVADTAWQSRISFSDSVQDMLNTYNTNNLS